MAAIIYDGIEGIEKPVISFSDFKKYQKECDNYVESLRLTCKENNKGDLIGEVIKFQVADGYAMYMVASLKPLELIHIDIMDGYESEFAELLTVKKITEMVQKERALKNLFSKKREEV